MIHCVRILFLCLALLVISPRGRAEEPLKTPPSRVVDMQHLKLDLEVSLKNRSVSGTATLSFQPFKEITQLTLDAVELEVEAVRFPGKQPNSGQTQIEFDLAEEHLTLQFPEPLKANSLYEVEIKYTVRHPKSGLYFTAPTEAAEPSMVWSQGEPESNRYWFPAFDHPSERQTTELIVTTESGLTVLSNGALISKKELEETEQVQFHWKQSASHVSYLVTLVVGEFALSEETWRDIPVQYYVDPGRLQDVAHTFGKTPEMLEFFSERFGIEYPWEKYAQVVVQNFIAGGMENTSASTLHDGAIFDERASLDTSSDWLIAHELGHQWWGDLVTCKDWSHLWLNEGFASYCEVLWEEHAKGANDRDYHLYRESRQARSSKALSRPIVDRRYEFPTDMFDSRVYPKGSWVLHMLRHQVGDDDFFKAINRYGVQYSFATAETSDLRKVFENLLGISLERFFYDWTERPGHPELIIETSWDPQTKQVKVDVKQTQKWDPFHFPLTIEIQGGRKEEPQLLETFISQKQQTFFVSTEHRPTLVRIDPEFTLLAKIEEKKSRDLWINQLTKTPGIAERLRAIEYFGSTKTAADIDLLGKVLTEDRFYGVQLEAAVALGKTEDALARDYLLENLNHDEPRVRKAVVQSLRKFEEDSKVIAALKEKLEAGDESYHVEAALIQTLAEVQQNASYHTALDWLKQDSHRDVLRQAALRSLGYCHDSRALDTLLEWSGPAHYHASRRAAMDGVVRFLEENSVKNSQQNRIRKQFASYLNSPAPLTRRSAISAVGRMGKPAESHLPRLKQLAETDPYGWARIGAANAVKQIESALKDDQKTDTLKSDLQKLREQNNNLEERIEELEKAGAGE